MRDLWPAEALFVTFLDMRLQSRTRFDYSACEHFFKTELPSMSLRT